MVIEERYKPIPVGVNTTVKISQGVVAIGGFLCVTGGTLTITNKSGTALITALPVTAGVFHSIPFFLDNGDSASVTTAGGASGILGV